MAEISSYYTDILNVLDSSLPWSKLSGSKILITGACGLIGGCLVEMLMLNPERDYHIYASGRNRDSLLKRFRRFKDIPEFHILILDVTAPIISDISFDFIIHAASYASPAAFVNFPVEVMKSNLNGVCNLMDYGLKTGLKRFLYISSGEVYGEGDGRDFSEEFSGYVNSMSSRSCYPSSKRAAETLCASYKAEYDVDVVIARPCHIYGPFFTESDNRVYAQFFRNILNDEDIIMKSTGEQFRSWCYVVDCASAIIHILLKGDNGEAYNIANPQSNVSIKTLATVIAKASNKKVIISCPQPEEISGYNPVARSTFSIKKIMSLGWMPQSSLQEGIQHSLNELV